MSYPLRTGKTTVVHVVGRMRDGGAEAVVRSFVPLLALEPDLDLHFLSIYDSRVDESERSTLGAPLHEIGRRSRVDLSFVPRLIGTLRRIQPQIVHAHSHSGKFAGRMAAVAAGVPHVVFSEHGDSARGVVHWSVNRLLNARTSRFVVFTEAERQRYAAEHNIAPSRIQVIANGIPAPAAIDVLATRRELDLRPGDFAIAMAARLEYQKNHELALRAVAALRAGGKQQIRLIIIGEGSEAEALGALTRQFDIAESVRFLGYRKDAQRLTAACDVMALASRWEKMPLVLGEAMMAGVPVVSTPWTGIDAFVTDGRTGYISADWSVEAFAAALARSIDDAPARIAIAERGKHVAMERFDLGRTVRLHADLYRELTSSIQTVNVEERLTSA